MNKEEKQAHLIRKQSYKVTSSRNTVLKIEKDMT